MTLTLPAETADVLNALLDLLTTLAERDPTGASATLDPARTFVTWNGFSRTIGIGQVGDDGRATHMIEAIEANPDDLGRFGLLLRAASQANMTAN